MNKKKLRKVMKDLLPLAAAGAKGDMLALLSASVGLLLSDPSTESRSLRVARHSLTKDIVGHTSASHNALDSAFLGSCRRASKFGLKSVTSYFENGKYTPIDPVAFSGEPPAWAIAQLANVSRSNPLVICSSPGRQFTHQAMEWLADRVPGIAILASNNQTEIQYESISAGAVDYAILCEIDAFLRSRRIPITAELRYLVPLQNHHNPIICNGTLSRRVLHLPDEGTPLWESEAKSLRLSNLGFPRVGSHFSTTQMSEFIRQLPSGEAMYVWEPVYFDLKFSGKLPGKIKVVDAGSPAATGTTYTLFGCKSRKHDRRTDVAVANLVVAAVNHIARQSCVRRLADEIAAHPAIFPHAKYLGRAAKGVVSYMQVES